MPGGVVQASATTTAGKTDPNVTPASYHVNKGTTAGLVNPPPGAVAAVGALPGIPLAGGGMRAACSRTSVRFTSPAGMQIAWFAPSADGRNGFTPAQVDVPGRYNFIQGGVYRLKLSNLPSRPMVELYPTLEVMPANARTATFLAHSTVPVSFTEEDFEQVGAGNLVVKVVYLPDPQFQDLAVAGPDEVVSTRLEPGVDPIQEATRRGSVLAVIRMGNIDLESTNTPALHAPPVGAPFQGMPLMTPPGCRAAGHDASAPRPVADGCPAGRADTGRDRRGEFHAERRHGFRRGDDGADEITKQCRVGRTSKAREAHRFGRQSRIGGPSFALLSRPTLQTN